MKNADRITLPDSLHAWAELQATVGGFESVDEFVSQVLREERRRMAKEAIELKLIAALDGGPSTPMTDADWEEMMQLALNGTGKKKQKRHATKR